MSICTFYCARSIITLFQYIGKLRNVFHLPVQLHSDLDTLNKSRLIMISAESTNSIDNLIDLLQRLLVHELVEPLEIGFDGCVVHAIRAR